METVVPSTNKKGKKKVIIISLIIVLVLVISSVIGYLLVSGKQFADITEMFKSHDEQSILLKEFVINLKSENGAKNYLKVQIALMYIENKHGEIIISNVNKIRDQIHKDLRKKTSQDILDGDNITLIKKEIINNINLVLKENIVKDVYFTDLVVQ